MLLKGVFALEPLAAALRFADEPGVSFAGFLVLLKAEDKKKQAGSEEFILFIYFNVKVLHVATA